MGSEDTHTHETERHSVCVCVRAPERENIHMLDEEGDGRTSVYINELLGRAPR